MLRRKKLAVLLLMTLIPGLSSAADRYVRPGASGNGSGSDWANAYASLPQNLNRGDTYYLADGSYGSYTFNDANDGDRVITIKKATVTDHGTGTGWSNSYGDGQAVFLGGWHVHTDYYVFDGARRNSNWRSGAVDQYGIRVRQVRLDDAMGVNTSDHGGDNLTFRNIDLHGYGRDVHLRGAYHVVYGLSGNSNITFERCALRDSDGVIFQMRGNWRNLVVDRNYIARNTSTPEAHGEMVSMTYTTNVTWSNNIMEDIEGTAFIAGINNGTASDWKIFGNVAFHSQDYGRDGRRPGHNYGVAGFIFVANDSSNNNTGNNFRVYNNTFYNIKGTYSGVVIQKGSGNIVENNVWYNSVRTNNSFSGQIGNNWYYNTHQDGDNTGSKVVCSSNCDIFVDPANNNFDLKRATAAGRGLASPYNVDPDGVSRGSDGVWDRGAFEFGGSNPPPVEPPADEPPPSTPSGEYSLLDGLTPAYTSVSDGPSSHYELGMRFVATEAGHIKAIRYYKATGEQGASHTGKLYRTSGNGPELLAAVTFSNESASGWQQQALAAPVAVEPGAEYIVTVNTGNTYYVATNRGLENPVSTGALRSVDGANGVYRAAGTTGAWQSWEHSNYFRDVVFAPAASGQSLLADQVPERTNNSDGPSSHYELGMRFRTTEPGQIKAVRFYKAAGEQGAAHTGKIYRSDSHGPTLLATVTFQNESASGWQEQALDAPLSINAGTEYIVAVNTGNTYYVSTTYGLADPVTSGELRSMDGPNGVFRPQGTYTWQSWNDSNYFRDVVFVPAP